MCINLIIQISLLLIYTYINTYMYIQTSLHYLDYDEIAQQNKEEQELCIICWTPSEANNRIKLLKSFNNLSIYCNCNPYIHSKCIETWINKTKSCPICRKQLFLKHKPECMYCYIFNNEYNVTERVLNSCFSFFKIILIVTSFNMFVYLILSAFVFFHKKK